MIKNKNQFVIKLWVENKLHMSSSEYQSVPLKVTSGPDCAKNLPYAESKSANSYAI